ncbi:MAG: YbjN domain-containing protein [Planctomycetota bacterium]|nr:MAG: YbjN domain-containing protein [Planctomycetota bacterium]
MMHLTGTTIRRHGGQFRAGRVAACLAAGLMLLVLCPDGARTDDQEGSKFLKGARLGKGGDQQILTSLSGEEMKKILVGEGYRGISIDEDGDIVGRIDEIPFLILVASDQKALLFKYSCEGNNADVMKVNEWNKNRRFSRAYVDDDGDYNIELDLVLSGGITVDRVKDFFETSKLSMLTFRDEVCGF